METELARTQAFFASMKETRDGIVHRLRAAGWSKGDAEAEADEKISEWDRTREEKHQEQRRKEKYTAEFIVNALKKSHFYLQKCVFGEWRLGCGIRSVSSGFEVPTPAAYEASKHPDVIKDEGGGWPFWRARRDDDAPK